MLHHTMNSPTREWNEMRIQFVKAETVSPPSFSITWTRERVVHLITSLRLQGLRVSEVQREWVSRYCYRDHETVLHASGKKESYTVHNKKNFFLEIKDTPIQDFAIAVTVLQTARPLERNIVSHRDAYCLVGVERMFRIRGLERGIEQGIEKETPVILRVFQVNETSFQVSLVVRRPTPNLWHWIQRVHDILMVEASSPPSPFPSPPSSISSSPPCLDT